MDFMKWLNSLDELLYEVMSWLLFFPLTLFNAVFRPFWTIAEVDRQTTLPDAEQYSAILSPPLFLALSLLLTHGVSTALGQTDAIVADHHGLAAMVTDETSALVLRVVVFATFPLFIAARLARARGQPLDRETLRVPFYEQCYPAAAMALGVGVGTSLALLPAALPHGAGRALLLATILNYLVLTTLWFRRRLGCGLVRAIAYTAWCMLQGMIFLIAVAFLFTR